MGEFNQFDNKNFQIGHEFSKIILECNGNCKDDKASYFKVICPGLSDISPHKLIILNDGSANKEYKHICQEPQHYAMIAHNNAPHHFEIDIKGNMVEYPLRPQTGLTSISHNYEILKPFFENYNITPTWINCNYTWGWFDEETGH